MNSYNKKELRILIRGLPNYTLAITNINCIAITLWGIMKLIKYNTLISILDAKGKWIVSQGDINNIRYVIPKHKAEFHDLEGLNDAIFKLELKIVPLFLNDFPEIVRWRLSIGK